MEGKFTERTAGIWFPLVFYFIGGAYMLAFWAVFDRAAIHMVLLGVVSILISVALYTLSRWAYWIGLFTFPLLFFQFLYALISSVNLAGWSPDIPRAAFHASLIVYLVFLSMSMILLIDRRSTLRTDRVLDRLGYVMTPKQKPETAS